MPVKPVMSVMVVRTVMTVLMVMSAMMVMRVTESLVVTKKRDEGQGREGYLFGGCWGAQEARQGGGRPERQGEQSCTPEDPAGVDKGEEASAAATTACDGALRPEFKTVPGDLSGPGIGSTELQSGGGGSKNVLLRGGHQEDTNKPYYTTGGDKLCDGLLGSNATTALECGAGRGEEAHGVAREDKVRHAVDFPAMQSILTSPNMQLRQEVQLQGALGQQQAAATKQGQVHQNSEDGRCADADSATDSISLSRPSEMCMDDREPSGLSSLLTRRYAFMINDPIMEFHFRVFHHFIAPIMLYFIAIMVHIELCYISFTTMGTTCIGISQ
jgi:hypothetical protein